ncbi:hypothetical protein NDU88_004010 [Pleurodeles waltl]|uniref:Uncharacterized protein n=1 Tax=Pleurodeles waltl TaxID=8319 RepID=A0AAV7SHJ5_PLEWA|nr:hypothetical protein NDU88_004010 [Pleurodeles waltl]
MATALTMQPAIDAFPIMVTGVALALCTPDYCGCEAALMRVAARAELGSPHRNADAVKVVFSPAAACERILEECMSCAQERSSPAAFSGFSLHTELLWNVWDDFQVAYADTNDVNSTGKEDWKEVKEEGREEEDWLDDDWPWMKEVRMDQENREGTGKEAEGILGDEEGVCAERTGRLGRIIRTPAKLKNFVLE